MHVARTRSSNRSRLTLTQLFSNPLRAIDAVKKQLRHIHQLDILTGFIGQGASRFLQSLAPDRTRIVFGLDTTAPVLAPAQWDELTRLRKLAKLRVYPGLHAKLYLFDKQFLVMGSANLTRAGFEYLQEMMIVTDSRAPVGEAVEFFNKIWTAAGNPPRRTTFAREDARVVDERSAMTTLGRRPNPERSAFSDVARLRNAQNRSTRAKRDRGRAEGPHSRIRICAYPAYWLEEDDSFARKTSLRSWSTGNGAKPGDLQLFCISKTLKEASHLDGDPRVDAVHSLWRMTGPIDLDLGNDKWPIQAPFELVVRFNNPVPYADMVKARLVSKRSWPMSSRGKFLKTPEDVRRLLDLLVRHNPEQRDLVFQGLGLRA